MPKKKSKGLEGTKSKKITLQVVMDMNVDYARTLLMVETKINELERQLGDLRDKKILLQGATTALSKVLTIEASDGR